MNIYYDNFLTDIGEIWIAYSHEGILKLSLPSGDKQKDKKELMEWIKKNFDKIGNYNEDKFYKEKIMSYLNGVRKEIDIPFKLVGTDFQKRVWKALTAIPFGEVRTYKEIASAIGNEKASRAVGMANNRNHLPIVIPCHRVIGSNGNLVGYGGGLHTKIKLLELEGNKITIVEKGDKTEFFLR
ncbi:MAG: methylated-DNA--[protein]-cysteine S-methyltransferase [Firmicutes bacterium]|nr:methylated-DNA--[protein]-cysteine S-methyltransferase [Bacillota bacterium]